MGFPVCKGHNTELKKSKKFSLNSNQKNPFIFINRIRYWIIFNLHYTVKLKDLKIFFFYSILKEINFLFSKCIQQFLKIHQKCSSVFFHKLDLRIKFLGRLNGFFPQIVRRIQQNIK